MLLSCRGAEVFEARERSRSDLEASSQECLHEYVEEAFPLITLVTPTLNAVSSLARTTASARQQVWREYMHIVVDGGSTDGTLGILKQHPDSSLLILHDGGSGIYQAINKGIWASSAPLLNVLNAGDYYAHDGVLARVAKVFEQHPEAMYVLGRCALVRHGRGKSHDGCGEAIADITALTPGRMSSICHQAFFYRRKLHEILGPYDERLKYTADGLFMYQALLSDDIPGVTVDEVLVIREKEGLSRSAAAIREQVWVNRRVFGPSWLDGLLLLKAFLFRWQWARRLHRFWERSRLLLASYAHPRQRTTPQ